MSIIIKWAILTLSIWVASKLLDGFKLKGSTASAFLVSALFGILSVLAGWLLFFFIGVSTLGLGFLFASVAWIVVNAILLKVADALTDRLSIKSFGTAIVAALIMSVVGSGAEYALTHLH
jgi:putative membrane protein